MTGAEENVPAEAPPRIGEAVSLPDAPPVIAPENGANFHGRLHPITLVLVLVQGIRGFLLPAIILVFFSSKAGMGLLLLIFLGLMLVQAFLRYFTFTYGVEGGELVVRQGVFERTERKIPLSRVQDLRVEQGVLHRIFGVVELQVETAGGQGPEATLSVLSVAEADRLRRFVAEHAMRLPEGGTVPGTVRGGEAEGETLRRVSISDLVLAGLTSNHAASAVLLIAAGWQFLDDIIPQELYQKWFQGAAQAVEGWAQQGTSAAFLVFFGGLLAMILFGMLISVGGSILLFYGFTLSRKGEDLRRSYGLLTRRASNLPRRRIQILKIEETFLRRWFGLATLRADTAGNRPVEAESDGDGRDVLLPVLPARAVAELLPELIPGLETTGPEWKRVSKRAIWRGTFKGVVVCCAMSAPLLYFRGDWVGLWPLVLILPIYWYQAVSYRHMGYALTELFFWARRGWLSRRTHVVPIRNLQTLVVRQNPFDRRHRLATLVVDTAGQSFTGGGPQIRHVPEEDALQLARQLAASAARSRYRT